MPATSVRRSVVAETRPSQLMQGLPLSASQLSLSQPSEPEVADEFSDLESALVEIAADIAPLWA